MSFKTKIILFVFKTFFLGRIIAFVAMVATIVSVYQLVGLVAKSSDAALMISLLAGMVVFYYFMIPKFIRNAVLEWVKSHIQK